VGLPASRTRFAGTEVVPVGSAVSTGNGVEVIDFDDLWKMRWEGH
jgi:hypothetical protein